MGDAEPTIARLLERAVFCGIAPAVVAKWGKPDAGSRSCAVGHAVCAPRVEPAVESTVFDLASLTKPLATTTLVLLAMRGPELSLDHRAASLLPDAVGSAVGELTVQQLLTHTSGLPAWRPLYCLADGSPDRLLQCLSRLELEYPPGTRVVYSCLGFVILGAMLEALAGASLDRLFRDLVTRPLGLEDAIGFGPWPAMACAGGASRPIVEERLVSAEDGRCELVPPIAHGLPDDGNARFLGGVAGNSGLFGTVEGVFRLAAEYLDGGHTLLTGPEIAAATARHTPGMEHERGLGWQLAPSPGCSAGPGLGERAFGHTGFTGTSVWVDPEAGAVFVLLTNRNHPWQRDNDLHPLRRRFHAVAANRL